MITRLHDEFMMGAKSMGKDAVHVVFTEADETERNVYQIDDPDNALKLAEQIKEEAMKAKGVSIIRPDDDGLTKPPGF